MEIFSRSRECYGGLRIVPISHRPAEVRWIGIAERCTIPRHCRAKSHISDNLRNVRRMACLAFGCWLAARSLSELLDGWSPQHFLAKRMITIVTHFRSEVMKFVFGGRNSGQNAERKKDDAYF